MSPAVKKSRYNEKNADASWRLKISRFLRRSTVSDQEDQKLSIFLKSLLLRPYKPNHIHLSLFLPDGYIEGSYNALLKDLNQRDQTYLNHILSDVLTTGKHFQITLTTESGFPICLYGFAIGKGYLLFSYPLSEKLEELDAERLLTKKINHQREELQSYCDMLPYPFWCRDNAQNIIFTNRAYKKFAGEDNKEIFQRSKARILARSAILRGEPQYMEVSAVKNGQRFDYAVTEIPFDDSQEHICTLGVAKDITDECTLRKQNKLLETSHQDILQHLSIAAILFDSKRRITYYNQAFLDVWGLTEEDIEEAPDHPSLLAKLQLKRRLPESRDAKEWRSAQFAPYNNIQEIYRNQWHLPDGRIIDVVSSAYASGGLISLYDDITEKVRLEKIYKKSVANLQETLDSLPYHIALFNHESRLIVFNNSMNDFAGFQLSENIHLSEFRAALGCHQDVYLFCTEIIDASYGLFPENGLQKNVVIDERTFQLNAACLDTKDILMTFRDITAQIDYEKILFDRADALKQLSYIREMLFRQVSYQLREPMTAISGFSEVLEHEMFGALNPKQKEYIVDIRQASNHMLELIDNLRDIVSLSDDVQGFKRGFKGNDLVKIIQSAANHVHNKAKDKKITLKVDSSQQELYCQCDFISLRQAILQLLYNAIHVTESEGYIVLSLNVKHNKIIIAVKDHGCGIDPAIMEQIHQNTIDDNFSGYGLLYVKRVCGLHNAELSHIIHDVGTEMRITLKIS